MIYTNPHLYPMRSFLLFVSAILATVAGALPRTAQAQDATEPPDNAVWATTLSNPNPNGLDTPNIISAIANPHSDLVLLSAHRGIHALARLSQAGGVPENSLESIGLAAEAGWEMVELDVKLTSDGVPILSHDRTWGREWCGLSSLPFQSRYDPFTPPGNATNDSVNPAINGTKFSDTRSYLGETVLRDSVRLLNPLWNHGCALKRDFGEYPPTLTDALLYIVKNHIRMVVMLDIQGTDVAKSALDVVRSGIDDAGRPLLNSVVFKMPATLFPNGYVDFANTFGADFTKVNFIPVINTSNVTPVGQTIADTEDGGFDITDFGNTGLGGEDGIFNWVSNMETSNQFGLIKMLAVEVGMKEPGGILSKVLEKIKSNQRTGAPMIVGEFNPVGEYYTTSNPGETPQFFRSSNGTCCDTLNQFLFNNPNGAGPIDPSLPVDHSDQRTDLNFLVSQGFQYLITDDPASARNLLQQSNKRNICYMQPTPTPNCASGGAAIPSCLPDDPSCQPSEPAPPVENPSGPLKKILFLGNSYTFGRLDPVMSYNASNVHDLTYPFWLIDQAGTNPWEPHPWGGVPGIFKMFTAEVGLNYDVSLSTRNGASLRGHYVNASSPAWDMRGNVASQKWDVVVLQERSDGALSVGHGKNASFPAYKAYVNKFEQMIHDGSEDIYEEIDLFGGIRGCENAGLTSASCNKDRDYPANPNASPDTRVFLAQTWARPDMVFAHKITTADTTSQVGEPIVDTSSAGGEAKLYFSNLATMTEELETNINAVAAANPGIIAVIPIGDAFQYAFDRGYVKTSDFYDSQGVFTPSVADGPIDLWWDDRLHARKYGSYLEALVEFGAITGVNPLSLGEGEIAARELGINKGDAVMLQRVASTQLDFSN